MSASPESNRQSEWDPVFLHARREAVWILVVWLVCLLWSMCLYWLSGRIESADAPALILGMPRWVVVAVVVPWIAADLFACWFCFVYMQDDDLAAGSVAGDEVDAAHSPSDTQGGGDE